MSRSLNPQNTLPCGGLRYEPVIMLDTTENRESDKFTIRRRRLLQFRIRVWNPVDSLRRTRMIVIVNVLANNPADVINTEKNKVVQGLLPERPVESFDMW